MKLKNSNSLTPGPIPPATGEDLSKVIDLFDSYYKNTDPINEDHYKHGKMIDKEVTADHVEVLKTLIYMLIDDIKSEQPGQAMQIEKVCRSVVSCIDLLPEISKNVAINRRIASKLIGYALELHKLHT